MLTAQIVFVAMFELLADNTVIVEADESGVIVSASKNAKDARVTLYSFLRPFFYLA
jgi:hypothetical protein